MLAPMVAPDATARSLVDFGSYPSGDFTDTNSGSSPPSIVVNTTAGQTLGGWLNIPTKAAANDYRSLSTASKLYEFLAKKPITIEARLAITESAANSASWYFGFTDTLTTGFLQTTGAPPTSFSGAVVYKKTGSNTIYFMNSNGSTQSTPIAIGTFVSGTPLILTLLYDPRDGVNAVVTPLINGKQDITFLPIQWPLLALSGLATMYMSAGIVASTTTAETLRIDYWGSESPRI